MGTNYTPKEISFCVCSEGVQCKNLSSCFDFFTQIPNEGFKSFDVGQIFFVASSLKDFNFKSIVKTEG